MHAALQLYPLKGFEVDALGRWLAYARNDESYRVIKVAILASYSSDPLANAVRVAILREGFFAEVYEAPYGAFRQDALSTMSGLYTYRPDLVVLALGSESLENLPQGPKEISHVEHALNAQLKDMLGIWTCLTQNLGVPVLQHTFVTPVNMWGGPGERLEPWSPANFIENLNQRMRGIAPALLHWLDVDRLAKAVGLDNWHDPRMWHHAKHGFSTRFLSHYTNWFGAAIRGITGRTPKALILDLDNTLWGGVIGDDGLEGVQLGPETVEGEAYQAFCRYIRDLGQRGVILGICSKNDLANVVELFEKHPHMPLKYKDFATVRCNWDDKATNLLEIAKELNIDLSAIVFVDDNPAECELIRQRLPMVRVIQLDGDPASFIQNVDKHCYFHAQRFLKEDFKRTESYQGLAQTKILKGKSANLNVYLKSLEMKGKVEKVTEVHLPRLAQMELKTNQFNMSTRRLTVEKIRKYASSSDHVVLAVFMIDRFTDHGLVAYVNAEIKKEELVIKDFIMSCRVFSRTLEFYALKSLLKKTSKYKCKATRFRLKKTEKNLPFQSFLKNFNIENENTILISNQILNKRSKTFIN